MNYCCRPNQISAGYLTLNRNEENLRVYGEIRIHNMFTGIEKLMTFRKKDIHNAPLTIVFVSMYLIVMRNVSTGCINT